MESAVKKEAAMKESVMKEAAECKRKILENNFYERIRFINSMPILVKCAVR